MNDYLLSVLLGIVEGLTEFLPVSSTAHLRLAEKLLGLDLANGYWKMYSIVIQLGAILCLPIYFRTRISEFLSTFPNGRNGRRTVLDHPLSLTAIAFVVTAVPALLLTKVIGKNLESIYVMGAALLIGGVVMWVVDAIYGTPHAIAAKSVGAAAADATAEYKTNDMEEMTLGQAIWIGACQITSAVFPGTSRSMSTIAGGQLVGMSRPAALEFSFFLSIPTMIAATGYDLFKSLHHKGGGSEIGMAPADLHGWIILAIGFVVSFIVAYAVVAWFMHWVRKHGFAPFAVYRIVVGIAVLAWAMSAVR
ncbi:MAG TPA: undecaprenyl-diphosphate phosphatase [Terriglobales bacterium]|nr:undecaprenyl-diphosphate phosphatase [Terriglobales bacterium]